MMFLDNAKADKELNGLFWPQISGCPKGMDTKCQFKKKKKRNQNQNMKVNTHSVCGVVAPQIWDMGSQKQGLLCRGSTTQFV